MSLQSDLIEYANRLFPGMVKAHGRYFIVGAHKSFKSYKEAKAYLEELRARAIANKRGALRAIRNRGIKTTKREEISMEPKPKPKSEPKPNRLSPPFSVLMFPEPTILYTETPMGITKRPIKRYTKPRRASRKKRKTRKTRKARSKPSGIIRDILTLIL